MPPKVKVKGDSKAAAASKAYPSMGDNLEGWNLGALCMTCRQLDRPESPLSATGSSPTAYVTSRRKGLCVSGKFQGLPGTCELLSP